MRTTVTLDEALVSELLELSAEETKTAAVTAAVKEQIRRAKLKKLAGWLGRVRVDDDALKAGERADCRRDHLLGGIGTAHGRRV